MAPQRTVAVVAVHGVADQVPGASARQIGNLLADLDRPSPPRYFAFDEEAVRIPVRPVELSPVPAAQGTMPQRFGARSQALRQDHAAVDPDMEFLRGQLSEYRGEGPADTYETVRLRGQSSDSEVEVHVYELFWADLSRLGGTAYAILGELYQILFHVANLGAHAISAASITNHLPGPWEWWARLQRAAAWMLAGPVAILNLALIWTAGVIITAAIPVAAHPFVAVGVAAIALAGAALGLFRGRPRSGLVVWGIAIAVACLGAWAIWSPMEAREPGSGRLSTWLALEAIALGVAAIWPLTAWYARRKPEVCRVARWILALTGLALLGALLAYGGNSRELVARAGFLVVELVGIALWWSWMILIFCVWGAFALGARVKRAVRQAGAVAPAAAAKVDATCWTARLALALPTAAFFILAITFWAAVARVAEALIPKDLRYSPVLLKHLASSDADGGLAGGFARMVVAGIGTIGLPVVLLLVAGALVLAAWGLLPVVLSDLRPPKAGAQPSPLGLWLNGGFGLLKGAGALVMLAVTAALPAGLVCLLVPSSVITGYGGGVGTWTPQLMTWIGVLVVGSGTGLLALRGRLDKLLLGFRDPLDVALDVDNYLRELPLDANPTARIFARYTSLLRYLASWKDARGQAGYDAVVIVAHSQGTAITADLLRLLGKQLNEKIDNDVAWLETTRPISLFTMGCPLRQLYGARFPHLYLWARHDGGGRWDTWRKGDIPSDQAPDPHQLLGVRGWVNAYRSGDYIGRHLWRADDCAYLFGSHVSEDATGTRREFCIGAGGHTHYWDKTAGPIAEELDRLIRIP